MPPVSTQPASTVVSIVIRPGSGYPSGDEFYSPGERYPEYPFEHVASNANPVYAMVRDLLVQAGLDAEARGTPQWNPFKTWIPRGARVFVLCNFVYHRRPSDSLEALWAKCTHGSVLRALVDYVLIATGPDGSVRFGNSPLQSCDWERVLAETGASRVAEFYARAGARVEPTDLRLYVAQRDILGRITSIERRDGDLATEFDLGRDSLLAELGRGGPFRISDYDPRRIEAFHSAGSHRYVIHRAILDSDVVFSLPKLKTHEKVGITCGLKGFVGTVGHKDCLAHHRFGNPASGGDEYPDRFALLRPLSAFHDWINRREPGAPLQGGLQIAERTALRVLRRLGVTRGGAWSGNDTAWRMALDLARIVHYGGADGAMHATPQRRHLSLIDGIVAGEGDGPLAPIAARAGCLALGDNVVAVDRVACRLMGFDPRAIPLVREAERRMSHPLVAASAPVLCVVNGETVEEAALTPVLGRPFAAPSGWRRHLEGVP